MRLLTPRIELVFHTGEHDVQRLRMILSGAFVSVEANKRRPREPKVDLPTALERLHALKERGALSDAEYAAAKQRLIGN